MDSENVEVLAYNWLKSVAPDGWTTSANIPKDWPAKFITIDRSGGDRYDKILDRAELCFEVYDKDSRLEASDMANYLADRVHQLADNDNITHVDINSVVHLDDTQKQYNRYQLYVDAYHRRNNLV